MFLLGRLYHGFHYATDFELEECMELFPVVPFYPLGYGVPVILLDLFLVVSDVFEGLFVSLMDPFCMVFY